MVLFIILSLLLESAIVEAQIESIQLKTFNASCDGKNCIDYFWKICPARKGQPYKSMTCLGKYDNDGMVEETFPYVSAVNTSFSSIHTVKNKVPERFVVYLINKKTIILEENTRHLTGRSLMLKLKDKFLSPASFFCEVELRSKCSNADCTGFMCDSCYTNRPSVNVTSVKPVVFGNNVTMWCYISPFTDDTIVEWIKSNGNQSSIINTLNNNKYGVEITFPPSLTIYGTDEDDVGNYICQARNVLQIGNSDPVKLSIYEYPTANVSTIKPAVEGTNVTIPCSIYPAADVAYVTWLMDDTIINTNNSEKYVGGSIASPSLDILFVNENDEGNYTCQVTNPVGTGKSDILHLNVVEDKPRVEVAEIKATGIGKNVTIICHSHSVSSLRSVTWFKDNIIINETSSHMNFGEKLGDKAFMYIYLTQEDDGGNYTCQVQNEAGRTGLSYSSELKVLKDRPTINISTVPPALAGVNVTIHCYIAPSSEVTNVIWLKYQINHTTIIDINDKERFNGGSVASPSLTIYSVIVEDSGDYACEAINDVGETLSVPAHLSVYDGLVTNASEIEPVIEGRNVTIPCYVSFSSKSTKVTWMKNNIELNFTGNKYTVGELPYPFLHIYFVQTDDEGNYTCLASNPVVTDKSKPVQLQVLPDIPEVNVFINGDATVGINITISCNISSVSKLTTINWIKDSMPLPLISDLQNNHVKWSGGALLSPSLNIYFIKKEDEGNYSCIATNAANHTGMSKPVHITVSEVTTYIEPSTNQTSTDHTFVTSELATTDPDSVSSSISTIKPSVGPSSVSTTKNTSTISTIKPSVGPSSVYSTKTTSSISTMKPSVEPPSVYTTKTTPTVSTIKPSVGPFSVYSTKTPTTISTTIMATTTSPKSLSTVKTSTTTKSTIWSTVKSTTISASGKPSSTVKSMVNSENINAWIITTTVICVVEFIVIVLVAYIMWLRKQRRLAMEYEKEDTAF